MASDERTSLPGGVQLIIRPTQAVAEVWLDRPEVRNAQTMATWASLARTAELISARPEIAVVLLRGVGDVFSAGLDLRLLTGGAPDGEGDLRALLAEDDASVERAIGSFQQGFSCWRELPAIVVAVVTGRAIGAGFQLALAADLRLLSDDAVLVMAEAGLGLVPDLGGTKSLVELVGYPRALQLCATSAPVEARQAERLGLADGVVPSSELESALEQFLAPLLAVDPPVVRAVKAVLRSAGEHSAVDQLAVERHAQVPLLRRLLSRSPRAATE